VAVAPVIVTVNEATFPFVRGMLAAKVSVVGGMTVPDPVPPPPPHPSAKSEIVIASVACSFSSFMNEDGSCNSEY
jgi:hypothetical protein